MADSSILSDFGINILEQEIDDVIFQTNEFLCDATFTGSQGPFWWLLVVAVTNSPKHDFSRCKSVIYEFLSRDTKSVRDKNGTKPRKNKVKNTSPEISLVEYLCFVCKGTNLSLENEGKSLFLSFTTHFPTIVLQMWLLQAILTSNSMTCENRVLNFVLHSVGHFQKRELAIEPKICHPYCSILDFGSV